MSGVGAEEGGRVDSEKQCARDTGLWQKDSLARLLLTDSWKEVSKEQRARNANEPTYLERSKSLSVSAKN